MSERLSRGGRFRWLPLAALLPLGSCGVGPDFRRPDPPQVERYDGGDATLPGAGDGQVQQSLHSGMTPAAQWWAAFGSAPLDAAVATALQGNQTLAAAKSSLAAARATLAAVQGARYPQLNASGAATRSNGTGQRTATSAAGNGYSVGASVSYDMDLTGATRRRVEQQAALGDVQDGLVDAAYLSLTGNVVSQAIAMANSDAQIGAVQEIIAVDERNLQLVQIAVAAGKSTGVDALAAEGQLASDRALLPPLRQQYDVARHALTLLTGNLAAQWTPPAFRLADMTLPADLPLTLPSELVRSRPDIRVAEAQLHAASAAIGVATSQLYPSVTLNGDWAGVAASTATLFDPASRIWSVAGNVSAPLFHGGSLRAQRQAAVESFNAQLALYRQVVLQSFSQVADALSALGHDAAALDAEQAALATTRASMELTQESFEAGQASFLQVLEAQRLFQQARLSMARDVGARYLDTVQYFLALGGDVRRQP